MRNTSIKTAICLSFITLASLFEGCRENAGSILGEVAVPPPQPLSAGSKPFFDLSATLSTSGGQCVGDSCKVKPSHLPSASQSASANTTPAEAANTSEAKNTFEPQIDPNGVSIPISDGRVYKQMTNGGYALYGADGAQTGWYWDRSANKLIQNPVFDQTGLVLDKGSFNFNWSEENGVHRLEEVRSVNGVVMKTGLNYFSGMTVGNQPAIRYAVDPKLYNLQNPAVGSINEALLQSTSTNQGLVYFENNPWLAGFKDPKVMTSQDFSSLWNPTPQQPQLVPNGAANQSNSVASASGAAKGPYRPGQFILITKADGNCGDCKKAEPVARSLGYQVLNNSQIANIKVAGFNSRTSFPLLAQVDAKGNIVYDNTSVIPGLGK